MAKRKVKKKIPKTDKEDTQIKVDLEDETYLWNGRYYANVRTGIIAPTKVQQILDDIRLKGEA